MKDNSENFGISARRGGGGGGRQKDNFSSSLHFSPPNSPKRDGARDRMGASCSSISTRRNSSNEFATTPMRMMSSSRADIGVRRTNSSTRQYPARTVKRNLTGNFDIMTGASSSSSSSSQTPSSAIQRANSSGQSGRSSPPTPHTPYGMLNPGPMHFSRGTNKSLKRRSWLGSGRQKIALMGLITIGILGVVVFQHDAQLHEALLLKTELVNQYQEHVKELERQVHAVQVEAEQLEEKIEEMQLPPKKVDTETQRKLFFLENNKMRKEQEIQKTSKRLLTEKYVCSVPDLSVLRCFPSLFLSVPASLRVDSQCRPSFSFFRYGSGPHYYVEMKLEFDPKSNVYKDQTAGDRVVLETASVDHMPHSVYLFLEQVSHGLYDGTSFHRNAAHVLQAGPSANPDKHAAFRHQPSLNSVMFQEYALEMSHKQYTVGYPGRPGGPDFYINMRDNSFSHGPGGQTHHYSDMLTDADPCFAKIVQGFEAIERVHKSEVEPGGLRDAMAYPVRIVKMTVLEDYVLPAEEEA